MVSIGTCFEALSETRMEQGLTERHFSRLKDESRVSKYHGNVICDFIIDTLIEMALMHYITQTYCSYSCDEEVFDNIDPYSTYLQN